MGEAIEYRGLGFEGLKGRNKSRMCGMQPIIKSLNDFIGN